MNAAFSIAEALRQGKSVRPTHMAVELGVSKQNVCQILARWELKGAIEKIGVAYVLRNANLLPKEFKERRIEKAANDAQTMPDLCTVWGISLVDIKYLPSKRYSIIIGRE